MLEGILFFREFLSLVNIVIAAMSGLTVSAVMADITVSATGHASLIFCGCRCLTSL